MTKISFFHFLLSQPLSQLKLRRGNPSRVTFSITHSLSGPIVTPFSSTLSFFYHFNVLLQFNLSLFFVIFCFISLCLCFFIISLFCLSASFYFLSSPLRFLSLAVYPFSILSMFTHSLFYLFSYFCFFFLSLFCLSASLSFPCSLSDSLCFVLSLCFLILSMLSYSFSFFCFFILSLSFYGQHVFISLDVSVLLNI